MAHSNWLKIQNSFLVQTFGEQLIPGLFMYDSEKFMGNGGVAIVGCHQMGSFPSRPVCYFYRILSTNRFALHNYYWAHDMFSRIFRVQINQYFHQYFLVEKEQKFIFGQERYFSVLSIWENQNKCYIIFGRKNS